MSSELYLFVQLETEESEPESSHTESSHREPSMVLSDTVSWVINDPINNYIFNHGSINDVAAAQHTVIVVLPGENSLFHKAKIPGQNRQRIQQAVPYVLEDSVIDDVDDLHFAISEDTFPNEDDSAKEYHVAVINKSYLEAVIYWLGQAGIQASIITVDYLLLTGANVLLVNDQRVLFNGDRLKYATALDCVSHSDIGLITNDKPSRLILCENKNEESTYLENLCEKYNIEKENCNAEYEVCLVKNSSSENIINLLQGPYKRKKNWNKAGKTWLPVAALFLIWLSVQTVLFIVDYVSLNAQNERLNNQITQIYKKTFPDSKRIIDAKAQMQQKLNSLKKRKGTSGRSFTDMLAGSAQVFSKINGLKIKSLRYYDGRINLELELPSLQVLEQLKKQLTSETDYNVEIQNASSGKDMVTAQLQITGAAL